MNPTSESLRQLAVEALEDLRGVDIQVLDVTELTGVTDYMVVASGRSDRQVRALADAVVQKAKAAGQQPLGVEGQSAAEWVLVDLGDVVVHVMDSESRETYQLEKLWQRPARLRALDDVSAVC